MNPADASNLTVINTNTSLTDNRKENITNMIKATEIINETEIEIIQHNETLDVACLKSELKFTKRFNCKTYLYYINLTVMSE